MDIEKLVEQQRAFFGTGKTMSLAFRQKALSRLRQAILRHEEDIYRALKADLNKSRFEGYMTEVGMALGELSFIEKHLPQWVRVRRVLTPLAQFHAKSFTLREPYGVALIMSPWNYPFMLCMEPLFGAIAAGNCCIVKPSAYAPHVSAVIGQILTELFPPAYVAVVEGGRAENQALLEQRFDYIFFTGSVAVGKYVMEKAAAHLTPVTLELGGKSPCIVEKSANLNLAAKRLVFGKYLNSGQTCVAPDYLLVEDCVKGRFLELVRKWIRKMFGEHPLENPDYPRMINRKHFDRVLGLMEGERIFTGGGSDAQTLQIAPTVLEGVGWDSDIMQEEIFGPVLPVLTFQEIGEVEQALAEREKPLALYLFTNNKRVERQILKYQSFGGGCVNDTIIHLATSRMGFGGVGASGMGSYHGKKSFEAFSHEKSIVKKYNWIDLPIRYQPYNGVKEALLRVFLR